ncbi:MAG TPA: metallophosphoesterase [Dongiaceae bacterium]|nr:metallophosphoesterase [Dongiaceae bacterium]
MQSLSLAHISDLHIGPLPPPGLRALLGKRVTGYLSWKLKRAAVHRREVLDVLAADLAAQHPDHIAVTGDLVNIALGGEFVQAREFLEKLGPGEDVTVVPGNHDAYVAVPWARSAGLWSDYMTGCHAGEGETARPPRDEKDFPFVRRLGDVALVGVSTAVPTAPFVAAGELGPQQLARLGDMLEGLGNEGLFRVVLIHHPPFAGGAYKRKSLRDAAAFAEVIARRGAELVLHGHMHISSLGRLASPAGPVPVFGVPSASAVAKNHKDPSRYHIYRISRDAGGAWHLSAAVRELTADGRGYAPAGEMAFAQDFAPAKAGTLQPQCA